jgi:3-phosphoglycerate kinase
MSHLGRPGGEIKPELSLKPTAEHLDQLLEAKVKFINQTVGEKVKTAANEIKPGQILVLENLRFHAGEKKNSSEFAQQLADLADVYINEAFSACHRAHASISGVPKIMQEREGATKLSGLTFAGLHLQSEIENLQRLMEDPGHPFVMVIGGAKISDKVEAVKNLNKIADLVLVGGGVANNFLKAGGIETHKSYLEDKPVDNKKENVDYVKVAKDLIEETKTEKVLKDGYIPLPKILFPIDVVAAPSKDTKDNDQIELINLSQGMKDTLDDKDLMYLDIGPRTIKLYQDLILQAETIFWNGPMGVFEQEPFQAGTREIARAIAKAGAETVIGGGDTIGAVKEFGFKNRFDYVSSAGGAALDFLAGKTLPGLEAVKAA